MKEIKLIINGNNLTASEGATILEVAKAARINIPTLCHDPRLKAYGACRLCLVEVKGAKSPILSCATKAQDGMDILTDTPALLRIRKTIVELLLSDHNINCVTCESSGRCKLQDLAYEFGIEDNRFKGAKSVHIIEDFNPLIERDPSKCVLCGRCVRICEEVQGNNVYTFASRSFSTVVTTPFDRSLIQTHCELCGQCVSACPTAALVDKSAKNKGRVWETSVTKTTCPYCGCGCELELSVKDGKIARVSTDLTSGVNKGNTCVKGRFAMGFINHKDRLKTPLIKVNGRFKEASFDEVIELIASKLSKIKKESGPDSIGFLASARCTNEDNYLLQKFARAVIGTNNIDHCARLCHAPSVVGLGAAFGSGAMTNSLADIVESDVIFVMGSNTTESHPIVALRIKKAVKDFGAKLIVIDPRRIRLADYADIYLSQKPGSDVALLNAIMHVIIEEGLADVDFIESRCENFEALRETVSRYSPELAEDISGVSADDIRRVARLFGAAKNGAIFYCMGLTQHTTGTDNVLSIANLAMLTGNIGRPGVGVNPLRGQNNVQGACDMGALPSVYPGYQRVADEAASQKFEAAWGMPLSKKEGLTITEMMSAALSGEVRALYVMGENPLLSDPDISKVEEALEKLDFLLVQDIFLTETAAKADVVLPAASFAEKEGTFTNTERRVQRVRRAIEAIGGSKEDWRIIAELSNAFGYPMIYESAEKIMEEIASLAPNYGGITFDRIEGGGLQWPCPTPDHPGTPILHVSKFTRGLGKFHSVEHRDPNEVTDAKYPLILTTGRLLYQYHTGTMTRKSEAIEEVSGPALLEINPKDAEGLGIESGDMVAVFSRRGRIEIEACVTAKIKEGTVFAPFHFKESPINRLTNPAFDPIAKIPELKVCAVRVERL